MKEFSFETDRLNKPCLSLCRSHHRIQLSNCTHLPPIPTWRRRRPFWEQAVCCRRMGPHQKRFFNIAATSPAEQPQGYVISRAFVIKGIPRYALEICTILIQTFTRWEIMKCGYCKTVVLRIVIINENFIHWGSLYSWPFICLYSVRYFASQHINFFIGIQSNQIEDQTGKTHS